MGGSNSRQQPGQHPTSSNVTGSTVGNSVGGNQTVHNMTNYVNAPPSSSQAAATGEFPFPFRCNMPLPTPHYQGRTDILKKIFDHFIGVSTQPVSCWRQTVAIVGMGGIGKSETASMFAKINRATYKCAAWINAETEQSALDSFLSLGKSLKIVPKEIQRADLELVKECYRHIDGHYCDQVLLIFDNAVKLRSDETDFGIFDYLPTEDLPNQRFPYVIITSQTPDWQKGIKTILIEELCEEESLSFFRSSLDVSSSECDKAFKMLHSHLQGYPLAMNMAASNIDFESDKHSLNWLQDEIELYVAKFQKEDSSVLTQKINQNWLVKYSKTLSTVWKLSFQKLEEEPNGSNALRLLQAVSFFHVPVNIENLGLVFVECHHCPGTPDWFKYDRLKESLRLLQKYHLINCVFAEFDCSNHLKTLQSNAEDDSDALSLKFKEEFQSGKPFWCEFRVHRLVQLVVRLDMDCVVVLEDILRFLAFWARISHVRELNVSAVQESLGRTRLSSRALAFVGLLALQGNSAARRIIQSSTAPVDDPAATIWRVLKLDKNIQALNEEAMEVLRAFIGLSTSENNLIDKRCFAKMVMDMFEDRRIFPYVRDDGTLVPGISIQSFTEIEGIASEVFSTGCSFTDVCSLPLLCQNFQRPMAATITMLAGNTIIEDLTKAKRPESRIAQLREELRSYREFAYRGNNAWHQFREEMREVCFSKHSWLKFESEVESCGLDQVKLKTVFSSIIDKIWTATDNKNLMDGVRLGHAFHVLDMVIYKFLEIQRPREIFIPLMESFNEILVQTEKELLSVLQNPKGNTSNASIWICSTWMNFCLKWYYLGLDDLFNSVSRIRILTVIKELSIQRIRDALKSFRFWDELQERHETMYDIFLAIYSESPVEEIRTLVIFCKEIQLQMSAYVKQMGHHKQTRRVSTSSK